MLVHRALLKLKLNSGSSLRNYENWWPSKFKRLVVKNLSINQWVAVCNMTYLFCEVMDFSKSRRKKVYMQ